MITTTITVCILAVACACVRFGSRGSGIQSVYGQRRLLQLSDSTGHYMDSLARICDAGFAPTDTDILYARIPTKGVRACVNGSQHFTVCCGCAVAVLWLCCGCTVPVLPVAMDESFLEHRVSRSFGSAHSPTRGVVCSA